MKGTRGIFQAVFVLTFILAGTARIFAADSRSISFDKQGYVQCGDIFNVSEGTIEFWVQITTKLNGG